MSRVNGVRLSDEVSAWVDAYAKERGVDKGAVLRTAVESFMADCQAGVPEIRAAISRQSSSGRRLSAMQGVGDCPERPGELGHIWKSPADDPLRSCVHCGLHGREPAVNFDGSGAKPGQGGGFFARATAERSEVFSGTAAPMQSGTGDPGKAHPRGLSPEMVARAAEIVADKKRRDALAREAGTGRPGQLGRK